VLVVLTAFALGLAVGVMGMVPRWRRQRADARKARQAPPADAAAPPPPPPAPPHGL